MLMSNSPADECMVRKAHSRCILFAESLNMSGALSPLSQNSPQISNSNLPNHRKPKHLDVDMTLNQSELLGTTNSNYQQQRTKVFHTLPSLPMEIHTHILQYLPPNHIPIYLSLNSEMYCNVAIYWECLMKGHLKVWWEVFLGGEQHEAEKLVLRGNSWPLGKFWWMQYEQRRYQESRNLLDADANVDDAADQELLTTTGDSEKESSASNHDAKCSLSNDLALLTTVPFYIQYWCFYFLNEYYGIEQQELKDEALKRYPHWKRYGSQMVALHARFGSDVVHDWVRTERRSPSNQEMDTEESQTQCCMYLDLSSETIQSMEYRNEDEAFSGEDTATSNSFDPRPHSLIQLNLFRNKRFLEEIADQNPRALRATDLFITVMQRYPTFVPQFDELTLRAVMSRLYTACKIDTVPSPMLLYQQKQYNESSSQTSTGKSSASKLTKQLLQYLDASSSNSITPTDSLIEKISKFVVARAKIVNSHHSESEHNPLASIQEDSIPYYSWAVNLSRHHSDYIRIPNWRRYKRLNTSPYAYHHTNGTVNKLSPTNPPSPRALFAQRSHSSFPTADTQQDVDAAFKECIESNPSQKHSSLPSSPNGSCSPKHFDASDHSANSTSTAPQGNEYSILQDSYAPREFLEIEYESCSVEQRLEENKKIRLVQELAWVECVGESTQSSSAFMGSAIIISQYILTKHLLKKGTFDAYVTDGRNQIWWTSLPFLFTALYALLEFVYFRSGLRIHPVRMIVCIILGTVWAFIVDVKHWLLDTLLFGTTLLVDTILPFALLYRFGSYTVQPYHLFHPLGMIWLRIVMLALGIIMQAVPAPSFIAEFLKSEGTLFPLLTIEIMQYILCIRPVRTRLTQVLRAVFPDYRRVSYFLLYIETCREQSAGVSVYTSGVWMFLLLFVHLLYGFLYLFLHVFSYQMYRSTEASVQMEG